MAFDIDRTKYDKKNWPIILGIWFLAFIITLNFQWQFYFLLIVLMCTLPILLDNDQRSKQVKIKRLHVALTRNGIYIDRVDKPGGRNLMMRRVIPYNQIQNCKVIAELSDCGGNINFKVAYQSEGKQCTIDGITPPQRFVDIVNAMIQQPSLMTMGGEQV